MLAEHQREAVERCEALLASRGAVVLADEVGLGKSHVAAEVIRRTAGEAELIVPAALVAQWRETLDAFGVQARIFTHDGIVAAPFVPEARQRLVVVDEAHAFRNPRTLRYAALARRTIGARVMLVTATPVCNAVADLEALTRLVACDDLLADAGIPSIDVAFEALDRDAIETIVAALFIRRDRSVLPLELRFGELERRVVRHSVPDMPLLNELQFPLVGEHAILQRFLRRRLESSEAALIESLTRQIRFYVRALAAIAAGRTLPKRDYRRAFAHEEDRDAVQEVLFWDLFAPAGEADAAAIRAELARLRTVVAAARESRCEKRRMLIELAAGHPEPMLVFTGAAATARDIYERLKEVRRCGIVTSRERTRDATLAAFIAGRIDVVISTDLAAEGLNLQRAGTVVHYDIPWNPVKLDQRNGRAHRIGQTRRAVRAIYFLPESRETRIVETVARKNRARRRLLAPSRAPLPVCRPTLRPRLASGAAFLRLQAATRLTLPELLARRHRAGLEQLMAEMSGEYLDDCRIAELAALAEWEAHIIGAREPADRR